MVRDPQQNPEESCISGCLFNLVTWVIILLVLASVIVALVASTWALPGEVLYPLKRLIEDTRLELTKVPSQRLELEETFDQVRLEEVESIMGQSRSELVEFSAGLSEVGPNGEWLVGDINVLIQPDTEVIGQVNLGTYVTVYGMLETDGSVTAGRIKPREYIFTDKLHSVVANQWLVDGVTVLLAPDTVIHGTPAIGSEITVKVIRLLDDQLVARLIDETSPE